MTTKKKRTYYFVVDSFLEIQISEIDTTWAFEKKEEAQSLARTLRKMYPRCRFKALRVTLAASPAGWK